MGDLLFFCEMILTDYQVLNELSITPDRLRSFIVDMQGCYMDNPYHNFRHGFDTMQTVYCFLKECGAERWLSTLDKFSLLVAAYSHDARHPGVTNQFMIASGQPLAVLYNDKSVLENYHSRNTFQLLRKKESNIMENFTGEQRTIFRRNVISSIVSTDLGLHGEVVGKFGQLFNEESFARSSGSGEEKAVEEGVAPSYLDGDESQCLMNMLIKAADISNPAKPFAVSRVWAHLIQQEMLSQGDLEQKYGLPISPHANREENTPEKSAHLSVKFISFLALPLFRFIKDCLE